MAMAEVLDLDVGTRIGLSPCRSYAAWAVCTLLIDVAAHKSVPVSVGAALVLVEAGPIALVLISAAAIPPGEATASGTAHRASHPSALVADSASSSSEPISWQGMRATTSDRISVGQ